MQILPSLFLQHYMQSYDAVIMTLVQDRQDKPHGTKACNAAGSMSCKVALLQYRLSRDSGCAGPARQAGHC